MLAVIVVLGYLALSRGLWLSEFDDEAAVGDQAVFSDVIDLGQPGVFTWNVPRDSWPWKEGEARLSLVLDRPANAPRGVENRSDLVVRLKVNAYAVPMGGDRTNRLIRNWYFTTDEPFVAGTRLWSTVSDRQVEHGIGGVNVYALEQTVVSIEVTTPQSGLAGCRPRLKLVGRNDYAVAEHIGYMRVMRDVGIGFVATCVVGLAALAWKRPR